MNWKLCSQNQDFTKEILQRLDTLSKVGWHIQMSGVITIIILTSNTVKHTIMIWQFFINLFIKAKKKKEKYKRGM